MQVSPQMHSFNTQMSICSMVQTQQAGCECVDKSLLAANQFQVNSMQFGTTQGQTKRRFVQASHGLTTGQAVAITVTGSGLSVCTRHH
jgi:hypothetical protein